jgi:hypothetical protein
MKNLMLIAIISLFAAGVNAQSAGPNELHCTEEAFTFRTDIRQGWHFSAPVMGPTEVANYGRVRNFRLTDALSESGLPLNTEEQINTDSFDQFIILQARNTAFYPLLYHVKLADQLKYIFPYNFQYPYQTDRESTKFDFQNQAPMLR